MGAKVRTYVQKNYRGPLKWDTIRSLDRAVCHLDCQDSMGDSEVS